MRGPARRPPRSGRSSREPRRLPFEVDRITLLRAAIAAVAIAFLYLILKVSMIAFGGTSARETKRIEHAVDSNSAYSAADGAAEPRTGSAAAPAR